LFSVVQREVTPHLMKGLGAIPERGVMAV